MTDRLDKIQSEGRKTRERVQGEKANALLEEHQVPVVVEVILDKEPEGVEAMRKFTVEELALSFPVLHDRFGIVGRKYGAVQLPHLVVLDGDKVVRWLHSGFTPDGMKQLTRALDGVLGADASAPVKSTPEKRDK